MKKITKTVALVIYYLIAKRFPTRPFPGYQIGYGIRRFLVNIIFEECGRNVVIKQNAYFGKGIGIRIGDNSQLGERSFTGACTRIGRDVIMGPEVLIWSVAHAFDRTDIPITRQEGTVVNPVEIGDDVWIGARVMIMPGVKIGSHSIVGAGSIVTRNVPEWAIVAGVPARMIRMRKQSQ